MKPAIKIKGKICPKPLVLLAGDNAEMRVAMGSSLSVKYRIIEAPDGELAAALAKQHLPDFIIFDYDVPGFGGNLFLQILRDDPRTQPIPVLLLFDRTKHTNFPRLDAQAFLGKPFIMDELQGSLNVLLLHRSTLPGTTGHTGIDGAAVDSPPATGHLPGKHFKEVSRPDIDFLEKLFHVFEQELENPDLTTHTLARMMAMSRTQLYRRLTGITGQSPHEMLRNYRLDRALQLLRAGDGNVSETAWRVGFGNSKYFSTAFKKRFGFSPGVVRRSDETRADLFDT